MKNVNKSYKFRMKNVNKQKLSPIVSLAINPEEIEK